MNAFFLRPQTPWKGLHVTYIKLQCSYHNIHLHIWEIATEYVESGVKAGRH